MSALTLLCLQTRYKVTPRACDFYSLAKLAFRRTDITQQDFALLPISRTKGILHAAKSISYNSQLRKR